MTTLTLICLATVLALSLTLVMISVSLRSVQRNTSPVNNSNEDYEIPSTIGLDTIIWSNGYNRIDFGKGNVLIGNSDEYSSDPTNYNSRYACDSTFPDDYESEIVDGFYNKYPGILYVFNLNRKSLSESQSSRTRALPVGIDFHTLTKRSLWGEQETSWKDQMKKLVTLRKDSEPIRNRKKRVLITWFEPMLSDYSRFHPEYMERKQLKNLLLKTGVCDYVSGTRTELWNKMCEYAFVYSPNGRGFDCHRTWEALALGCIVIAQDNPAIREFISLFPIVAHRPGIDTINKEYLDHLLDRYTSASLNDLTMDQVI